MLLRKLVKITLLAGLIGVFGILLTQPSVTAQLAQYLAEKIALIFAVGGLVLLVVLGVITLVYGLRLEGRLGRFGRPPNFHR